MRSQGRTPLLKSPANHDSMLESAEIRLICYVTSVAERYEGRHKVSARGGYVKTCQEPLY